MDYKLEDLIDFSLLQSLMEKLNVIYSLPSSIIDSDGKILISVGWQDICKKFHRSHPESKEYCVKKDKYILEHLSDAKTTVKYQCQQGLINTVTPIIIEGQHLGNFYVSQFFYEKPDMEIYKLKAKKFGYSEKEYLTSLDKVPICSKDKLDQYLDLIKEFIEIIAGIGIKQIKEFEINKVLTESEEWNKTIIQSISDWIWEVDINGKYTYCSENVEKVLGYTSGEIIGKTPFDLMPDYEREKIGKTFQNLVESKKSIVDLENWNLHKDGHEVCFLTNGFPIFDENGDLMGYRGADKDITEKKLAENKIHEKDIEFRKLSANVPSLLFQFTRKPDGSYCVPIASEGIINIFGCRPEDVIDNFTPIANVIHPDDTERVIEDIEYSAEHLTYFTCEFRVQIPGREIQWIYSRSTPEKLPDGSITWYGFNVDITERKLAADRLFESDKRFKDLVDMLPEAVVELDMDLNITYINKCGIELSGYSDEDIKKGVKGINLLTPESQKRAKEHIRLRLSGIEPGIVEYQATRQNGTTYPILFHANSIVKNGNLIGLRCLIIDLSEQKKSEQALKEIENLFSLFMKYSPVYTFIKEVTPIQSIVLKASENFKDMIGIPGSEMSGKTVEELFPPEFAKKMTDDNWDIVNKGEVSHSVETLNGLHYTTIKFPIKNENRNLLAGFSIDITERIKTEKELSKYRENLEELVKERTNELLVKNDELERLNNLFVGREFRIKELRDKVKELEARIKNY